MHNRCHIWIKLAQQKKELEVDLSKMPGVDIRSLPGVKRQLLSEIDWSYLNKIFNGTSGVKSSDGVNAALWTLSNGNVSLESLFKNSTQLTGGSKYTNSLKSFVSMARYLFNATTMVNRTNQQYSKAECKEIAENLLNILKSGSFPEQKGVEFKNKITQNLNNWINILGNA
jgi:hypothetical protein